MPEIYVYLLPLLCTLKETELRNFDEIISAMLCMSGKKTMLNISRWTQICYRTIERFYNLIIPWLELNIYLVNLRSKNSGELIVVADETPVIKSGKKTHGLDKFFNSIYQKVMSSLKFSGISLIDVDANKGYGLLMSQLVFTPEEKANLKKAKEKKKKAKGGKRGPKIGSKNNPKKETELTPTFRLLKSQLTEVIEKLRVKVKKEINYFMGDGGYGNSTCAKICKELSLFLISKLQSNAALYLKYTGPYSGRGRKRIYGDKINYDKLPEKFLCETTFDEKEQVQTKIYQFNCLNKEFEQELNVVIQKKINFKTKKEAHVIFFSTDLDLSFDKILKYYSSRFQIEFNFRDAKEFWGLQDFMNVKELPVKNAANLSLFMTNFSNILLSDFRNKENNQLLGIRDLISGYRSHRYISDTLKLVEKSNPNFILPDSFDIITSLGRIHV